MPRFAAALLMALTIDATAQVATDAPPPVAGAAPAIVERIKVEGASLVGNLEGNSASREVLVVLPPSYATSPTRRYPVVYALHGYSIGAEQWVGEIHVPQTVTNAFALGAHDMIVVIQMRRLATTGRCTRAR